MIRIQEILDKVTELRPDADVALIQKAYVFSAAAHAGQTRLSGEPYLSHPLSVAYELACMRMDDVSIAAGLLHDTVEDTSATIEVIDAQFGEEVADVVDGVTKISLMTFESKEAAQAENIRKMILAMAEDIRVLIVKLADRVHNMRTLDFQKTHKQKLISQETMDIYVPLANRLGLHRIKLELEDLSFRYLRPEVFSSITEWLEENRTSGQEYIQSVIQLLSSMMAENAIKAEIKGRIKYRYSIYRKMEQQSLTLDQVHDIIAFRVVVKDVRDCYAVLGLVHAMWRPVHGRFKDYISMPKANMYQSLHTTVMGPEGERIEIQIRTDEMDQLAEFGVASHWLYKEGGGGRLKARDVQQFTWLRELLDWQKMETDSKEFMRSLKFDLFKDEVYVFTPGGDVKELPEEATPIDFAYTIHTHVGDKCSGAKVNGKLVPLSTPLKNGDTVEIITDQHRHPSRDWLRFVKTAKARTRINHFIRTEERTRSISLGKEMLEKLGRRMDINVQKALKEGAFGAVAEEFNLKDVDELLSQVGYARLTPRKILQRLQSKEVPEVDEAVVAPTPETRIEQTHANSVGIKGVDDVLVRFARCCTPVPGEAIIGYISRGRGVTVHTSDCPNVQSLEAERLISVFWDGTEDKPYPARIKMIAKNIMGMMAKVSDLLMQEKVNLDAGMFHSMVDGMSEMEFTVEVRDIAHLYRTIDKLRALEGMVEVSRLSSSD
jgi:GTP pyrophosphokinase